MANLPSFAPALGFNTYCFDRIPATRVRRTQQMEKGLVIQPLRRR
jgi:hypothetical protein